VSGLLGLGGLFVTPALDVVYMACVRGDGDTGVSVHALDAAPLLLVSKKQEATPRGRKRSGGKTPRSSRTPTGKRGVTSPRSPRKNRASPRTPEPEVALQPPRLLLHLDRNDHQGRPLRSELCGVVWLAA
jgi:hypothetical protein